MKKKTVFIILIILISIIELIFIKPLVPAYFGMVLTWKILYIIILYGFPVLILLPIAISVAPFALALKKSKPFISTWFTYIQNTFLVFGIALFILLTLNIISKFVMKNDTFTLINYSSIKGYEGNTEDLKTGEFEYHFGTIKRYKNKQVETNENGDSIVFDLAWISKNEYVIINLGKQIYGMNDTLIIKITNNTPDYYECYKKYGKYAEYQMVIKR